VYQAAKRSTIASEGDLLACAEATRSIMRATIDSLVGLLTRTSSDPAPLTVPPKTSSSTARSTGIDSPVNAA